VERFLERFVVFEKLELDTSYKESLYILECPVYAS